MLEHSVITEGRITREELEYYLRLDLSEIENLEDKFTLTRDNLINRYRQILQYIQIANDKWYRYGYTTQFEQQNFSHGSNNYSNLYLKECGVFRNESCDSRTNEVQKDFFEKEIKQRDKHQEEYKTQFNKLSILVNQLQQIAQTLEYSQIHIILPHANVCYQFLLDIILQFLPGRTFIKMIK